MKHPQITSRSYRPERSIYYVRRKRLTNPSVDVISVTVLAAILIVAHYLHG
jgi:hypothetical protein